MAAEGPFKGKNRFPRMMWLLGRLGSSSLPPVYGNCRVLLFPRGRGFFRALHAAIRRARGSILVEYYLIRDDRTGRALAEALASAVRRGVRVWLIYDALGSLETPSAFFEDMARQGIEVTPFNVPSVRRGLLWFDRRDHRKMVVIDGAMAFLGGCNIGDEYSGLLQGPGRFRDFGFGISGNAVGDLVRSFRQTWWMERGELPEVPAGVVPDPFLARSGRAGVVIVSGGPHQRGSYIRSAFLFHIAAASEEIIIATPYFVPGLRLVRSLMRAARRGIKVMLLLPARSDVPLVQFLGRSYYTPLLKRGIEIRELAGEILHAKVMLVDGTRTILGSANLDQRSFHRNFEINGIVTDARFGVQVRRMLSKDLRAARRITLDVHEGRGWVTRILERGIGLFGRFL